MHGSALTGVSIVEPLRCHSYNSVYSLYLIVAQRSFSGAEFNFISHCLYCLNCSYVFFLLVSVYREMVLFYI